MNGNPAKAGGGTTTNGTSDAAGDVDHDDDESENDENGTAPAASAAKKKRKRKPKKKKNAAGSATTQSDPPRVPVANLFPNNAYPEGEICEYPDENAYRTTSEEKRHLDRMNNDFLTDYRRGAEVHRQVRQAAQRSIKPGQTLTEIAENIEGGVRALTGHPGLEEGDNLKGGMGFPDGAEPQQLRSALYAQRGQQDGAAAGRRHESRLWRAHQRPHRRQRLHHDL